MRRFLISGCLLFLSVGVMAGGGWNAGKGKGYFKIGQSLIVANQYFTPAGDVIPITTIGQYISYGYGEYGLTDRLDLNVYLPFFSRATLNELVDINGQVVTPGDQLNSLGDVDISIKYGLIRNKPFVLSATLTLGIPTGNPQGGASKSLQTGDGEFNQMLRLDASRSFSNFYLSSFAGYNHRTNNFSDEFRYGAEIGKPFGKWYFIFRLHGIKPLNDGDQQVPDQINALFGNRIEYMAFTPELNYQLNDRLGLSASMGGAFYAKRVLAAPNFGFGVYLKL